MPPRLTGNALFPAGASFLALPWQAQVRFLRHPKRLTTQKTLSFIATRESGIKKNGVQFPNNGKTKAGVLKNVKAPATRTLDQL
jgi:hypothetical protein